MQTTHIVLGTQVVLGTKKATQLLITLLCAVLSGEPTSATDQFCHHFYPSRLSSKPFALCAPPKTGCSQWIMLLHFLLFGQKDSTGKVHESGARTQSLYNGSNMVPKILIMRNPYDRVLSSYFDFKGRAQNTINKTEQANVNFTIFVRKYIKQRAPAVQPMDHRQPISELCNIWDGTSPLAEWDYVLKLEEMELWSDCLFKELNLTHVIDNGWGLGGNSSLFYHGTDILEKSVYQVLPAIMKGKWASSKAVTVGHERKHEGYSLYNPETVSVVNAIFEHDFQVGRYSLWDGRSHEGFY
mmetsp:Transcript_16018/g.45984  ORF Transcript_16018/g.45984 Transcript_16018/m.45984 type:complete len:298 (+) Transcript_16018:239-1132(+)